MTSLNECWDPLLPTPLLCMSSNFTHAANRFAKDYSWIQNQRQWNVQPRNEAYPTVCLCMLSIQLHKSTIIYAKFSINLYIGDYENVCLKTGNQLALPTSLLPNVGIALEFGWELVSVMSVELCTEKPNHGKYPCAAETLNILKLPL